MFAAISARRREPRRTAEAAARRANGLRQRHEPARVGPLQIRHAAGGDRKGQHTKNERHRAAGTHATNRVHSSPSVRNSQVTPAAVLRTWARRYAHGVYGFAFVLFELEFPPGAEAQW